MADVSPAPVAVAEIVTDAAVVVAPVAVVVAKIEVATPLVFVFGEEVDQDAVPLVDVGVARVRTTPLIGVPITSVTVKVIVAGDPAGVVPEITMVPCPKVTVSLSDKVPAVTRTVAIPAVELNNVTSAFPAEFTFADAALKVPRVVVKLTVPDTLPVTVAVIREVERPSAATVEGFTVNVKVLPDGEVGMLLPLVLSQPEI